MPEYKSLYRKYRPKTFLDVYGQEHITKVLQNQVANQKVSHAYLFCGSRGTGKTTCAKILAKAVNCLSPDNGNPCNACDICRGIESGGIIDVIEMDAASNRRVEDIREVREDVAFTPGDSTKKVYIVDEVHMLTTEAFNALLKTLEEPPPHIIFILATTEINKVPATILSRCQRHDFRRIPPEVIAECLNYVCGAEDIKIEGRAVDLIARLAGGALRDALSILEVCAAEGEGKTITFEYASKISGYFDTEKMTGLCACVKDGDARGALRIFWDMYDNSMDCNNFCASLLEMLRNIQVAKLAEDPLRHINLEKSEAEKIIGIAEGFDAGEIMRCAALVSEVIINLGRYTVNKRVAVEMMLFEMCLGGQPGAARIPPPAQKPAAAAKNFERYADLIEAVNSENKIITPYLKSGRCVIDEGAKKITIYSDSEFKAELLKDAKNIAVISGCVNKFMGEGYHVTIELQKPEGADGNGNSIDDIINSAESNKL